MTTQAPIDITQIHKQIVSTLTDGGLADLETMVNYPETATDFLFDTGKALDVLAAAANTSEEGEYLAITFLFTPHPRNENSMFAESFLGAKGANEALLSFLNKMHDQARRKLLSSNRITKALVAHSLEAAVEIWDFITQQSVDDQIAILSPNAGIGVYATSVMTEFLKHEEAREAVATHLKSLDLEDRLRFIELPHFIAALHHFDYLDASNPDSLRSIIWNDIKALDDLPRKAAIMGSYTDNVPNMQSICGAFGGAEVWKEIVKLDPAGQQHVFSEGTIRALEYSKYITAGSGDEGNFPATEIWEHITTWPAEQLRKLAKDEGIQSTLRALGVDRNYMDNFLADYSGETPHPNDKAQKPRKHEHNS